jgi:glycosyltransferase involved in cell wall biosynthesis
MSEEDVVTDWTDEDHSPTANAAHDAEPRVTVVVAVRNAAATLEQCIHSVAAQDYSDHELIVMDAASTDGSADILRRNADKVAHWESKVDRGIGHAWNKALAVATGKWISFLGADDSFTHAESLRRLVTAGIEQQAEIVSSRVALVDEDRNVQRIIGEPWDWARMKRFQRVAHHGMLHRTSLFHRFGEFSEEFRIVTDYEWLLRLGPDVRAAFVNERLVDAGSAGESRTLVQEALKEAWKVQARHREIGRFAATINLLDATIRASVRRGLRVP